MIGHAARKSVHNGSATRRYPAIPAGPPGPTPAAPTDVSDAIRYRRWSYRSRLSRSQLPRHRRVEIDPMARAAMRMGRNEGSERSGRRSAPMAREEARFGSFRCQRQRLPAASLPRELRPPTSNSAWSWLISEARSPSCGSGPPHMIQPSGVEAFALVAAGRVQRSRESVGLPWVAAPSVFSTHAMRC
jgi:hypothetical protein